MNSWQILLTALSCAFTYSEVIAYPKVKPFVCCSCLTAWFALLLGVYYCGGNGIVYLPVGYLLGSVFSGIRLRYL